MRLSKDREDDEEGVMAVSCGMALVPGWGTLPRIQAVSKKSGFVGRKADQVDLGVTAIHGWCKWAQKS